MELLNHFNDWTLMAIHYAAGQPINIDNIHSSFVSDRTFSKNSQ